mmetsp:Transcript_13644/g.34754  ORF Transcript_13644/g.34754 Transcript_13644/m.34754 type:complete len:120 (-) Transcript_13644:1770-2129(-)
MAGSNPGGYRQFIEGVVLQGLLALADSVVVVRCRQEDVGVVREVVEVVAGRYREKSGGKEVKLSVDDKDFLSSNCTGGVTLFSHGGRIMLENTFESRLEIAYQQNLPILRTVIFGETAM